MNGFRRIRLSQSDAQLAVKCIRLLESTAVTRSSKLEVARQQDGQGLLRRCRGASGKTMAARRLRFELQAEAAFFGEITRAQATRSAACSALQFEFQLGQGQSLVSRDDAPSSTASSMSERPCGAGGASSEVGLKTGLRVASPITDLQPITKLRLEEVDVGHRLRRPHLDLAARERSSAVVSPIHLTPSSGAARPLRRSRRVRLLRSALGSACRNRTRQVPAPGRQ